MDRIPLNYGDYVRVTVIRNYDGIRERGIGTKVTDLNSWLVVSNFSKYDGGHYGLFVLQTGRLIAKVRFDCFEDAINTGQWIEHFYSGCWDIISSAGFPEQSLFDLAQHTIKNGQKFAHIWKLLEKRGNISYQDLMTLLKL